MGDPNGNGADSILIALGGAVLAAVIVFVVIPIHDRSIRTPEPHNPQVTATPDPKSSVVTLPNGVSEFCNGTTMIYKTTQALTAEPNSAECQ